MEIPKASARELLISSRTIPDEPSGESIEFQCFALSIPRQIFICKTGNCCKLNLRADPNELVTLVGHGSKTTNLDMFVGSVKGWENEYHKNLQYFGKDFHTGETSENLNHH
jgi:hypothetical protein